MKYLLLVMGLTTGNVIIESNAATEIKSTDITLEAADILKLEGEKRVVIDSTGRIFLEGMIKCIEGVDVSPLAASTGNLTSHNDLLLLKNSSRVFGRRVKNGSKSITRRHQYTSYRRKCWCGTMITKPCTSISNASIYCSWNYMG